MRTGPRALRGVPGLLTDQANDVLVRGVLGKAERLRSCRGWSPGTPARSCSQ